MTKDRRSKMPPYPLDCPAGDWKNDPGGLPVAEQIAGLLGHLVDAHGDEMPDPVRSAITACKRELQKLPV